MSGNDSYTVSLLHMNGADQSTTFTDDAAGGTHTWTPAGNAQIDTAQSEFGGACGLFDGTGDYISTPYSADFDFGTGDFTIDLWIRWNQLPTTGTYSQNILGQDAGDSLNYIRFTITNDSGTYNVRFTVRVNNVIKAAYVCPFSFSINTWYHIAVVRSGSDFYIFINGTSQSLTVQVAISTNSITLAVNALTYIAARYTTDSTPLNGWLDEARISKGIARWTSNFTPPTEEYSSVTILSVSSLLNNCSVGSLVLTQIHQLVASNLSQVSSIGNVIISKILIISDLSSDQVVGAVSLSQVHNIVVASLSSASSTENAILTQLHNLIVQSLYNADSVGSLTLAQVHQLIVQSLSDVQSITGSLDLSQNSLLIVSNLSNNNTIGSVLLSNHYFLTVQDLLSSNTIGKVLFVLVPRGEEYRFLQDLMGDIRPYGNIESSIRSNYENEFIGDIDIGVFPKRSQRVRFGNDTEFGVYVFSQIIEIIPDISEFRPDNFHLSKYSILSEDGTFRYDVFPAGNLNVSNSKLTATEFKP